MGRRRGRPGPTLPYRTLGGVVPCPGGWVVVNGRLQGITLGVDRAEVMERFVDVLDYRPSFEILTVALPIGLPDKPRQGGRSCDKEARKVLGWPRSGAILSAPCRTALGAETYAEAAQRNERMSPVLWRQLPRIAEVDGEMQPYRQREVFEVHPELSFHQINGDRTLAHGKHTVAGREERRALLVARLPGVERALDTPVDGANREHLLDAAAALWTARRIASRSLLRVPIDPEWDEQGLRMELVR